MAYVPPHRRNSRGKERVTSPTLFKNDQSPEMSRNFRQNLALESRRDDGGFRVVRRQPITKWFIVPSVHTNHDSVDGDNQVASSIPFKLVECGENGSGLPLFVLKSDQHPPKDTNPDDGECSSSSGLMHIESIEDRSGEKPTILVWKYLPPSSSSAPDPPNASERLDVKLYEIPNDFVKTPWRSIAVEIQQDLLTSFQDFRNEMFSEGCELVTPSFIVKFGKNLLGGLSLKDARSSPVKTALSKIYRAHDNDIPHSIFELKLNEVIAKIGVDFTMEKEYYLVKVFDRYRRHANVTCKCNVDKVAGKLHLCKIELNQEPYLIIDISFLNKKLDPRLMLSSKRILTTLTDNDKKMLRTLVESAIIDSEEKGGLRWPVENETRNDRYTVIAVWHKKSKVYKSSSMRLKLRQVDRFNIRYSNGELREEVTLEMTEINRKLRDAATELGTVTAIVNNTIKMLWEDFL